MKKNRFASVLPYVALAAVFLCPSSATVVRAAPAAPGWLIDASRIDLGHLGDGAAAVIVGDWKDFSVDATGKFVMTERCAIRVLIVRSAEKYLEAGGFENRDIQITSIQTWAIAPSGRVTQSSVKDVGTVPQLPEFDEFKDVRRRSIKIPGAEDGSLVGFEIVTQGRNPVAGRKFQMEEFIPVRLSELHVTVPSGSFHWFLNHPDRVTVVSQTPTEAVFRAENRPAIPDERNVPPVSSVAGEVFVNYDPKGPEAIQTWDDAGRFYHLLDGANEKSDPTVQSKATALITQKAGKINTIEALYSYVAQQVRYVPIEIETAGYLPRMGGDVLKAGYGACEDKANLLIEMLHQAGLQAYPALIGTRLRMEADPAIPTLSIFNHIIVALRVSEDLRPAVEKFAAYDPAAEILWIDPTSEDNPLGELPEVDQGVYALIVASDHGELHLVPEAPAASNGIEFTARARLQADGKGSADVDLTYFGSRNSQMRRAYRQRTQSDILKEYENRVSNFVSNATFQNASISGVQDTRQQIREKYSFQGDFSSASSGDSWFFQPLFFSGITNQEYNLRPRKLPSEFATPRHVRGEYSIELPPGMRIERVPDSLHIKSDFGELEITYALEGNILTVKLARSSTASRVSPEQYPAFRDFQNSCLRAEAQKIRIVKTSS
jgi:uncharacterized protein DUF3857